MANYGEELAYWYLRLNGFFPIGNLVVHKSEFVEHSADVDLIGIRLPHVYEEVGGRPQDWDSALLELFDPGLPIGVICEVKTGVFSVERIFKDEIVAYSVGRFGFTPEFDAIARDVSKQALTIVPQSFQIAKVLFSNACPENGVIKQNGFFHISLSYTRDFIERRISKYPKEKWADRMFFSSLLVQDMIDATVLDLEARGD